MIVGGYTLHLYCDFCKASDKLHAEGRKGEFAGSTKAACFKEARKSGWKIYTQQRKAKCQKCASA